jgi:hypothetical protein
VNLKLTLLVISFVDDSLVLFERSIWKAELPKTWPITQSNYRPLFILFYRLHYLLLLEITVRHSADHEFLSVLAGGLLKKELLLLSLSLFDRLAL